MIQLQGTICPETGAGLGGVEVAGCGIVSRIQANDIALSIEQLGNAGEEDVGLAISLSAGGKLQCGAAAELEGAVVQIRNCGFIRKIEGKRIIPAQSEGGGRYCLCKRSYYSQHTGNDGFTKQNRQVEFHRKMTNCER